MDGLAGGLYDQMVRQVKGLDCIVEGGGTVIGCAGGVGQGAGIDSWDQAVLVADIGHEFGILGALMTSVHLSATTTVVATLSLGGSVSTTTTVGPALLLLGKLGVHLLALYSAELVGLRAFLLLPRDVPFCSKERVAAFMMPLGFRVLISLGKVWERI